MDKWIGCNPRSHLEVDKWQEREDNSLDPCLTNRLGEGEKTERREGRRRGFERERVYLLSIFPGDRVVKFRRDKRQS